MKHAAEITGTVCLFLLIVLTIGEPDLLDALQIRLLTQDVEFCRHMVPPVAGMAVE